MAASNHRLIKDVSDQHYFLYGALTGLPTLFCPISTTLGRTFHKASAWNGVWSVYMADWDGLGCVLDRSFTLAGRAALNGRPAPVRPTDRDAGPRRPEVSQFRGDHTPDTAGLRRNRLHGAQIWSTLSLVLKARVNSWTTVTGIDDGVYGVVCQMSR